jgi:site-specific DNA-cytosine methylase
MRYGSVCSGIEAATVAWHPLGWRAAFFSEIEAFPRAVLKHHWPDVPLHGDFTTIKADEYGPIDLLVGGTPCQSFSVAGLRGGLADDRGNLALEFLRLAQRTRPQWLVWENVPGVLSSNGGRDFGSILGAWSNSGMASPTESLTLSTLEFPSGAVACSLSDILETGDVPRRFFLSATACKGILRRAEKRGRALAPSLQTALEHAARTTTRGKPDI